MTPVERFWARVIPNDTDARLNAQRMDENRLARLREPVPA